VETKKAFGSRSYGKYGAPAKKNAKPSDLVDWFRMGEGKKGKMELPEKGCSL